MRSLISHVGDPQKLLDDLNYLNMDEIRSFCDQHAVPYRIMICTSYGELRRTKDFDRKGIILDRIRRYLKSGRVPAATCFPASVVSSGTLTKEIKATDPMLYGQYDKKNVALVTLLKKLTSGKFRDGAIARILANEFWRKGTAPTYQEFAARWLQAQAEHWRPNPEWAFLSDLSAGKATTDWKQLRATKAKRVLKVLRNLEPEGPTIRSTRSRVKRAPG